MVYNITIPYTEFQKYLCQNNDMTAKFGPFVDEEGNIEIMYMYGNHKNGQSIIKFSLIAHDELFGVLHPGSSSSSPFAMWWSGVTYGNEDITYTEKLQDINNSIDSVLSHIRESR
jgi:hypothetical protein